MKHAPSLFALTALLAATSPAMAQEEPALHAQDFDLEAVVALIEQNRISDAAHLEEVINSEESGINNVDIDWDGLVDRVAVLEMREGDTAVFELIASPSSDPDADGAIVASITFTDSPDARKIQIVASFPETVEEHERITFSSETQHPIYSDDYDHRGFTDWVYEPLRPAFIVNVFNFESEPAPEAQPAPRAQPTRTQREILHSRATFRRNRRIPPVPTIDKPNLEGTDRAGLSMRQVDLNRSKDVLRRSPMSLAVDLKNRPQIPAQARRVAPPRNIIYIYPSPLEPSRPAPAQAAALADHSEPATLTQTIHTTRTITTRQVITRSKQPQPVVRLTRAPLLASSRRVIINAQPLPIGRSAAQRGASANPRSRPVNAAATIPGRRSPAKGAKVNTSAPRKPAAFKRGARIRIR